MSRIDESQVRAVSELARLELDEGRLARLAQELETILGHFDELARLELEVGRELDDRGLASRTRADAPGADALAFGPDRMAPDWRSGYFVVPRLSALGGSGPGGEAEGAP